MTIIRNEVKSNFDTWKNSLEENLYGDQYKNKMEKKIIEDEIYETLIKVSKEG